MCFVHVYICCRKALRQLQYHLNVFQFFCKKLLDIQLILQLSRCLSVTNISKHNMFGMCDFMLMQHNSHSHKVSL